MAKKRKWLKRTAQALTLATTLATGAFTTYSYGYFNKRNIHSPGFEMQLVKQNPEYKIEIYQGIEITGNDEFRERTRDAIDLIIKDGVEWSVVRDNLTKITSVTTAQNPFPNKLINVDTGNGRVYVNSESYFFDGMLGPSYAATLSCDEAGHVSNWKNGKICSGPLFHKKSQKREEEFLARQGHPHIDLSKQRPWYLAF